MGEEHAAPAHDEDRQRKLEDPLATTSGELVPAA
jgi:hypothetical protein